jgi:hypothetical protein
MDSVKEYSSCEISFDIEDEDNLAIPNTDISTITLSIFDYDSGQYLISGVDIKSYVNASGSCTYHVNGSYNSIIDPNNSTEKRVVLIMMSGVGVSAAEVTHQHYYTVENMFKLPY